MRRAPVHNRLNKYPAIVLSRRLVVLRRQFGATLDADAETGAARVVQSDVERESLAVDGAVQRVGAVDGQLTRLRGRRAALHGRRSGGLVLVRGGAVGVFVF